MSSLIYHTACENIEKNDGKLKQDNAVQYNFRIFFFIRSLSSIFEKGQYLGNIQQVSHAS
jgi:hypothetical protein